jgi:hypothetical protein
MDGVAAWKGIEALAGNRNPPQVATERKPIWPFLVKHRLEEMRQRGDGNRGQQDMITGQTCFRLFGTRPYPPSGGERTQGVLVGAPGKKFGHVLDLRGGVAGDGPSNRDVAVRRPNCDRELRCTAF